MTVSSVPLTTLRASPMVRRAVRDGLGIAGLLFAAYLFIVVAPKAGTFGFDAYAYWSVNMADPYTVPAGTFGAFTYSPVIARLFSVFSLLAWPTFLWLWTALLVGTVIWLGWRSALLVLAFPPVALELYHGNVHLLMAAAIVLGFRYPIGWSFLLLTKVTPGIGLIWFAVRREWRPLAIALGFTGALVAISFAFDRQLWVDWLNEGLGRTASGTPLNQFSLGIPLVLRVPLAAVLVAWGGRTGRPWTVPAAATLALPILWPSGLAILAALWPIAQRRPEIEPLDRPAIRSTPAERSPEA
jgi:Glycosyltransferase family 87